MLILLIAIAVGSLTDDLNLLKQFQGFISPASRRTRAVSIKKIYYFGRWSLLSMPTTQSYALIFWIYDEHKMGY